MKLKKWMLIGGVVMLTAFTAAGCGTENKENNKNNKQGSSVSPASVEEKGSRI